MKLPYSEGSVFLVPLRTGGYGRGVVARMAPKGRVLLGYFFGPRLISIDAATLDGLVPEQAALRIRIGDLGLMNGEWHICGSVSNWNRCHWPIPEFARRAPGMRTRLVRYSDDNPNHVVAEQAIDDDPGLSTDSLSGYRAVEIKLDQVLR